MMAWASRRPRGPRGGADAATSGGSAAAGAGGSAVPSRRHGRRPIRSSLTGPALPNPDSRVQRFELAARGAIEVLRYHLGDEMRGVRIAFATAPLAHPARIGGSSRAESERPMYYSIDRSARTILLYRMPIQRARVLHVDDAEHRRMFIEHCVYVAVCEYLGRDPWDVLPGRFEHY